MKTLFRLIVLVLLIAGWGLAALSLHVVRAQGDRIVLIPKQQLSITDTYVDAREWKIDNVAQHEELVERIIQSGKSQNFAYVVDDPKGDVERQLHEALRDATHDSTERSIKSLEDTIRKHAKSASTWWDLNRK